MEAASNGRVDGFVVMGGGSASDLWCRILADVSGRPVERASTSEASSLGAAIAAAVGAGWYPGFAQAAGAMVRPGGACFDPGPRTADLHAGLLDLYGDLYPRLRDLYPRLAALGAGR